jgi:hypothetical protein
MILSCDPPRQAFLIHFGKRQQPDSIRALEFNHQGARMQIALNPQSVPPTLVAIHFVRHNFRLPFVGRPNEFSTQYFSLRSAHRQNQYFFYLSYEPRDCQEWQIYPGLTVLVSESLGSGSDSYSVNNRPVLHGLVVDTEILGVDIDNSEFVYEFGADTLKDVSVSLFVKRIPI